MNYARVTQWVYFNEYVYILKYDGRGLCSGVFRRGLVTTDDTHFYFAGLVQDCNTSIALAMEVLHLHCVSNGGTAVLH